MKRSIPTALALGALALAPSAQAAASWSAPDVTPRQVAAGFAHHTIAGCRPLGANTACWYFTPTPTAGSALTGGAWLNDVTVGRREVRCRLNGGRWEPC